MNLRIARRCCCSLLLAGWFAVSPAAQVPLPGTQFPGTQPSSPFPSGAAPQQPYPGLQDPQRPRGSLDGLNPVWAPSPVQQPFAGFPVFNPKLAGYGAGYPRRAGDLAAAGILPMPVVPPMEEDRGWPNWARARDKAPLTYAADKALLVRHSDRVWWKAPDEDAFVPLYFYDKLRLVAPGTDVEVRQTGDFELLLHGGSRLVSLGRAALRIEALTETKVELRLLSFTRLRLEAIGREQLVHLPDGSSLMIPADVAEQPVGPANLVFDRAIEPSWFGGRATIFNGGQRAVQWTHAFGSVPIAPGERVGFFLTPPAAPVAAELVATDVTTTAAGVVMTCVATKDGTVSWSGARFKLKAGDKLRLDPLLGDPFAPVAPKAAAEQPAK